MSSQKKRGMPTRSPRAVARRQLAPHQRLEQQARVVGVARERAERVEVEVAVDVAVDRYGAEGRLDAR